MRKGIDWAALRLEYINGAMTMAELAAAHGIKDGTLRQRVNRDRAEGDDWHEARNALSRAVTAEAQNRLGALRVDALAEFNQADLDLAVAIRERAKEMLDSGVTTQDDGEAAGLTSRDLNAIAKAAESAQKIGRLALGVSTENLGHGGPGGEGPIAHASLTPAEYAQALKEALAAF